MSGNEIIFMDHTIPMFIEVLPRRPWWKRWLPDRRKPRTVYGRTSGVVYIPAGVWNPIGNPVAKAFIGAGKHETLVDYNFSPTNKEYGAISDKSI